MKPLLIILSISISLLACKSNKNHHAQLLEGDLYFKLIDFQKMFDAPDSFLTAIEDNVRTVNLDTLSEDDKRSYALLKYAIDNHLLRQPYVNLRQDDGKIKMLFIDTSDYNQLKTYRHGDLVDEHKKVRIKASVSELKYDSLTAYRAIKMLSIEKVDGKTYWSK